MLFQFFLERAWTAVLKTDACGAGETAAVYDRGVIELIRKDDVVSAHQSRNDRQIRVKTGLIGDRGLDPLEARELFLQLVVQHHVSRNSADRGRPDTEFVERLPRGFLQLNVIGKTQVVVGAEVQYSLSIHRDPCALGRLDRADADQQPFPFEMSSFIQDKLQLIDA